jgi:hypothetical protein
MKRESQALPFLLPESPCVIPDLRCAVRDDTVYNARVACSVSRLSPIAIAPPLTTSA